MKTKILEIEKDIHHLRMMELKYVRETEILKHKQKLEFLRIKNAEIRKAAERRRVYDEYKQRR